VVPLSPPFTEVLFAHALEEQPGQIRFARAGKCLV